MKDLIVLRTHVPNSRWEKDLNILSKKFDIIIIADERRNKVGMDQFEKIIFNDDNIKALDLFMTNDMQWRFGDYALYLAHVNYKEKYRHIWLFEPDVYFNNIRVEDFISLFDKNNDDLLIAYFGLAGDDWAWSKYLPELKEDVAYKCFFPVLRIKYDAVEYLYCERKKISSLVNDEMFVASKLANNNFSISNWSDNVNLGNLSESFVWKNSYFIPFIKSQKNKVYHPVCDNFLDFFRHVKKRKSWKHAFKLILNQI